MIYLRNLNIAYGTKQEAQEPDDSQELFLKILLFKKTPRPKSTDSF